MVELCVCVGTSCHLRGSYNVVQAFQRILEDHALHDKVALKSAFCMRECNKAGVQVSVNGQTYRVDPEAAGNFFKLVILPIV